MPVATVASCVDCGCGPMVSSRMVRADRPDGAVEHEGRGLCSSCYTRHRREGTLADFERCTWSRGELLAEIEFLAGEGFSRRQMATRIGMRLPAFERQYWLLRAAGLLSLTIQRVGA